jgi:hypothetical protein
MTRRLKRLTVRAADRSEPQTKHRVKTTRRADERTPAFKLGTIIIGRNLEVRCVVTNLNRTGASVRLEVGAQLPPAFLLKVGANGMLRKSRLVWQDERDAGLQFVPSV